MSTTFGSAARPEQEGTAMSNNRMHDIDRILDVARGAIEGEPMDVENRRTVRTPYGEAIGFVQWTPDGGKSIATVVRGKDISSSGLSILSRYMLHVGHEGAILILRSNAEEIMLGVKVVHCSYVGDMNHESGLTFIKLSEQFSLDDFRDQHGKMPELRKAA